MSLKLLFVWSIYVGSAILFMNDGLISLTLVEGSIKEKKPVVYGVLKAIQYIAAIGICGLVTSQLFTIVGTQMNTGEATTVLKYPLWVMKPWNASWTCPDCNPRSRKTDWFKRIFCEEGSIRDEKIY